MAKNGILIVDFAKQLREAGEARIAVGWVIVLGFATVFTLFLTLIFYRWIAVWGTAPGAAAKRLRTETEENARA